MKKYELIVDGKSVLYTDDIIELENLVKVCKIDDRKILSQFYNDLEQIFDKFPDCKKLVLGHISKIEFELNLEWFEETSDEILDYIEENNLLKLSELECKAIYNLYVFITFVENYFTIYALKNSDGNVVINVEL